MFVRISTFLIIMFLLLPIFIVIPISFSSAQYLTFPPPGFSLRWYENFFSSSQWVMATVKSFQIGILTVILSLFLGILASIGLHKSEFRGKQILQEIFMLPMVVPTIIVAIAIYKFQSQYRMIGTTLGLVCAHTVLAMPFVISTVYSALRGIDPNLENAALNLGANRLQVFFRVTFSVIKPAIFSASLFAFATSFDELVVTLFISGVSSSTLPKMIWDGVRTQIDPTIAAISSILIVSIALVMLISTYFENFRKHKQIISEDIPS